jgi:hypothetical protein
MSPSRTVCCPLALDADVCVCVCVKGIPGTEKLAHVSLLAFGLKFLQVLVLSSQKAYNTDKHSEF